MQRWGLVVAALLGLSSATQAQEFKTHELLVMCAATDNEPTVGTQRGLCAGYIKGVMDTHALMIGIKGARPFFCAPKQGVPTNVVMDHFVRWGLANQKSWSDTARVSVMLALAEVMPCR